jgi:hypothetical protein
MAWLRIALRVVLPVSLLSWGARAETATVDWTSTHQIVDGFGAADADGREHVGREPTVLFRCGNWAARPFAPESGSHGWFLRQRKLFDRQRELRGLW